MSCKGICIRHRAQRPSGSFGRYATGQKRCQVCSIFLRWDGLWCPCCGYKVRTRPRCSKYKQKLRTTIKEQNNNKNKNKEQQLLPMPKEKDDFIRPYL
jgi:predicted amidophosphoribosyltransferase